MVQIVAETFKPTCPKKNRNQFVPRISSKFFLFTTDTFWARSEAAGMFIKEDTVRTHFDAPQSLQEAMAMGWMVTESKDTNPSMVPNNNCPVSELLLQRSWASSDCLGLSGMDGQWAVTRSLPLPDVTGQSAAVAQPSWHHHPAYQQDMMGEMMQMLLLFTQRCACL